MKFSLNHSIELLERTPSILESYLYGLSDMWLKNNEGEQTWSPYTILGHLIHGEKTDWIVRIKLILGNSEEKLFEPFDRFAQFHEKQNQSSAILLKEFKDLREQNIIELKMLNISESDIKLTGIHPEFGSVTLAQLISTWVVHDLGHIAQISRVMANQYKLEVGPWVSYLGVLNR